MPFKKQKVNHTVFCGFFKENFTKRNIFVHITFHFFLRIFIYLGFSINFFSWFLSFALIMLTGMCEVSKYGEFNIIIKIKATVRLTGLSLMYSSF